MSQQTRACCQCGRVELAFIGRPIIAGACYCNDCQAAAHQLACLPGAPQLLEDDGGTECLLYRNDKWRVTRGTDLIKPVQLREGSVTRRVIATCCNTPLYLAFSRNRKRAPGETLLPLDNHLHWVTAYRRNFGQNAPAMTMRLNTKWAPDPAKIPKDVPVYKRFPPKFIFALLAARLKMLFKIS